MPRPERAERVARRDRAELARLLELELDQPRHVRRHRPELPEVIRVLHEHLAIARGGAADARLEIREDRIPRIRAHAGGAQVVFEPAEIDRIVRRADEQRLELRDRAHRAVDRLETQLDAPAFARRKHSREAAAHAEQLDDRERLASREDVGAAEERRLAGEPQPRIFREEIEERRIEIGVADIFKRDRDRPALRTDEARAAHAVFQSAGRAAAGDGESVIERIAGDALRRHDVVRARGQTGEVERRVHRPRIHEIDRVRGPRRAGRRDERERRAGRELRAGQRGGDFADIRAAIERAARELEADAFAHQREGLPSTRALAAVQQHVIGARRRSLPRGLLHRAVPAKRFRDEIRARRHLPNGVNLRLTSDRAGEGERRRFTRGQREAIPDLLAGPDRAVDRGAVRELRDVEGGEAALPPRLFERSGSATKPRLSAKTRIL